LLIAGMFLAFYLIASLKTPDTEKISNSFIKYLWNIQKAFTVYRSNRLFLISGLLLGFVGPITLVIVHFFLVKALGMQLSLTSLFFYIPTVSIFAQLPITVNGFGLQDYFMVQFLGSSLTPASALTLSIAFHAVRLGIGIIGGLFYISFPRLGKTEPSQS
ncbi:flippase-like domain-containing protein, partial [bacterium]|nr:flippase-like domain-containing protein [bacterium]